MQGTRVTTAEDRGPTPVKLERVGWTPARGPYGRETGGRGGQGHGGWMDVQYRCVPWQAWQRGQGLMDTDTDPDGADEGQNVTPSRRRSKGAVASPVVGSFTMGASVARGATPWLLTWALPTVAVTLRMRWGRRGALQYVHALCRVHADRALRACVALLDMPTYQAGPKGPRGHD